MEPTSETPPKKACCRLRFLKDKTIGRVVKDCGSAGLVKDIIKDRLSYESGCLKKMEKRKKVISKMVADNKSRYPEFKQFLDRYETEFEKGVVLQQSLVSKLAEVEGPYEMIQRWLDTPTTKSKQPEEWYRQYSSIRLKHARKIMHLKKEKKVLTNIREQLALCQRKLLHVQAAIKIELNLNVAVSADQIKEQKTLRGQEQELINRQNKSLQQYRASVMEEAEIRLSLEEDMTQITGELEVYNEERLKVSNASINRFSWILNQQETHRRERRQATFDILAIASPRLLKLPETSLLEGKRNCVLYKFPDFAEQLRDIRFSMENVSAQTSAATKTVMESPNPTNTYPSKDTEDSSTKTSSSKDTEDSLTKPSSAKDTEDSLTKPSSAKDTEYSLTKPSSAKDTEYSSSKDTEYSSSKDTEYSSAKDTEDSSTKTSSSKDTEDSLTKTSSSKDTEYSSKKPSSSKDAEYSSSKPFPSKVSEFCPAQCSSSNDSDARPVQSEEKPKRKLPKPPKNKDPEDEGPPRVPKNGWESSDMDDEDESVKDDQQEGEQNKSAVRDVAPPSGKGVPLEKSRPLKVFVKHKATDSSYLSLKKGQKIVQTHKATEEGIAYGFTRKHSYSNVKYGYFHVGETKTWKPTARNILKNLFI